MNIVPYLLRLWRHGALLYVVGSVSATVEWGVFVFGIGMFLRAIFDGISGDAQAGINVYFIIGLFTVMNWLQNGLLRPVTGITDDFLKAVLQSLVQRNLFRTMLDRRPVQNGPGPGETLNRFRDDVEGVVEPMFLIAQITGLAVSVGAALYVMVNINPLITVVAFVPAIVVVTVTKMLGRPIEAFRQRSRQATSRVSGSLGEFLGAVQALQVANAEERAVRHFQRLSDRRRSADLKEGMLDGLIQSLNGGVVTISTTVILLAAAQLMRSGSFTVGDFALFVYVAGGPQHGVRVEVDWELPGEPEARQGLLRAPLRANARLPSRRASSRGTAASAGTDTRGAIPAQVGGRYAGIPRLVPVDVPVS